MKVLLIVLGVLLVLLLLPFGAAVRYDEAGFMAWVKVLFFRFRVFPSSPKKKEKPPKKPKEPPPSGEDAPAPEEPKKKGGTLDLVRAALPLLKPALVGIKRRLVIDDLELHVAWAAADPASAAIGCGCANAALGTIWAVLDQNFKVKKSRLGCGVDFDSASPTVYLNAGLSLNLWKTLTLVLPLLVRFLKNYSRLKRERDLKTKKEV